MQKIYNCEACGGIMEFDVKSQALKCSNCNTIIEVIQENKQVKEHLLTKHAIQTIKAEEKASSTMECKGCGAKVEVNATCTAVECPYCGSDYVLAQKQESSIIPDAVVPFKIDKNQVGEIFRDWLKKRWLAPNELRNLYQRGKLQGIYMPYWTFDAKVYCKYTAMGGRDRRVAYQGKDGKTNYRTETDWFFTHGKVQNFFDDVLERASEKLKPSLLKGVEPYDTKSASGYSPDYLSGYSAECFTIDLDDAYRKVKNTMKTEMRSRAGRDILRNFDRMKDLRIDMRFEEETYKHILLPVYSTAYTYKGKDYTVLVNGQTGNIKGDYPKSGVKIAFLAGVAILALLGAVLFANSKKTSDYQMNGTVQKSEIYALHEKIEDWRREEEWDYLADNYQM